MRIPRKCAATVLALMVTLGLGMIAPLDAAYDKAYRFKLPSGWTEADALAVRATLNAMESVTEQYDGWWNPYADGAVSWLVLSGVYCTRIRYQQIREQQYNPNTGEPWTWDQALKIGWSTFDSSCRLSDLKWIKTDGTSTNVGITADQSAVPGGGELVNIAGQWFWRIWNDPPLEPPDDPNDPPEFKPIILDEVETWAFEEPLTREQLYQTTETGMSADNVSCIIETLIPELRAAVVAAGEAEAIPADWVADLTGKLDRAAADAEAGLVAFRPPNLDEPAARFLWGRAAQHVKTFVSQVQNEGGEEAPTVPAEWIEAAQEIIARLLALPGAPPSEGVAALRDVSLTAVEPPTEVPPGEYVDIPLEGVGPGDAVVIHGVITDPPEGGEVVLEWSEQGIIPAETTPPTPTITPVPDYHDEEGVGHYRNNPGMVTLSCADPDFAAMCYGFCTGLDGDELPLTAGGSVVQVSFQASRQLVYFAQDTSGNTSNYQIVVVDELFVDDDWTGPGNCGGHLWQVDAFDNIQDAIDVAQTGFTVFVENGTYPGGIVIPNSITLTSQSGDPTACIIDGGGTLQCISLPYGDNEVIITGFGIRNGSGTHGPGLGVYNQSKAVVTNCILADNSSSHMGGAIYVGGGYSLTELVAANCVLVGNSAANYGGGLGVHGSYGRATLTNCTFTSNSAGQQGGAAYAYTVGNITATNCIFWGDSAPAYPELRLPLSGPSPITYSDVQGGWSGTGNLDADPLFADAGARDFHLRSVEGRWHPPTSAWVIDSVHSPCIDSGDPASSCANEPEPNGERVNMGAYGNTVEASKTGSPPDIMWVDDDWTGPDNCGGHEWQVNAFNSIQDAIDAAPAGYTIHVAAGTYEEHLTWTSKLLSLTGAGAGTTIVDGTKTGRCLTMTDVSEGSTVEGFTFTNGEVPVTVGEECGGVLISGGAPTLRNNAVTHNISHSDFGGGVECWDTGAVFEGNLIANNEGFNTGGFFCGGFSGVLRGNTIIDNTSLNVGGVHISNYFQGGGDFVIEGNTITGNYGGDYGGGRLNTATGRHYLVIGNQISGNSAKWRTAGMALEGDSGSSFTLINNVVTGNALTQAYRPAALFITGGVEAILLNNTVAHNEVEGVRADSLGPRTITNCIIWNNATADLCGAPWGTVPTPVQLTYSDVGVIDAATIELVDPVGNLNADPLFVNAAGGDFRLSASSPCIDTGDKDAPDLPETDIEGNPRIVNAEVDMGAYEYQGEGASSSSGLVIASASAAPTGVGAEIIFTLSRDADVAVSVLNIAGRPIRRVATNRAATAGRNSVLWNACSDNGLRVPNGAYLIQIEAKTKDGSASRALTTVRIAR